MHHVPHNSPNTLQAVFDKADIESFPQLADFLKRSTALLESRSKSRHLSEIIVATLFRVLPNRREECVNDIISVVEAGPALERAIRQFAANLDSPPRHLHQAALSLLPDQTEFSRLLREKGKDPESWIIDDVHEMVRHLAKVIAGAMVQYTVTDRQEILIDEVERHIERRTAAIHLIVASATASTYFTPLPNDIASVLKYGAEAAQALERLLERAPPPDFPKPAERLRQAQIVTNWTIASRSETIVADTPDNDSSQGMTRVAFWQQVKENLPSSGFNPHQH